MQSNKESFGSPCLLSFLFSMLHVDLTSTKIDVSSTLSLFFSILPSYGNSKRGSFSFLSPSRNKKSLFFLFRTSARRGHDAVKWSRSLRIIFLSTEPPNMGNGTDTELHCTNVRWSATKKKGLRWSWRNEGKVHKAEREGTLGSKEQYFFLSKFVRERERNLAFTRMTCLVLLFFKSSARPFRSFSLSFFLSITLSLFISFSFFFCFFLSLAFFLSFFISLAEIVLECNCLTDGCDHRLVWSDQNEEEVFVVATDNSEQLLQPLLKNRELCFELTFFIFCCFWNELKFAVLKCVAFWIEWNKCNPFRLQSGVHYWWDRNFVFIFVQFHSYFQI